MIYLVPPFYTVGQKLPPKLPQTDVQKHNRRGVLLEDSLPDRIVHAEAYTALFPNPMWVYVNFVFIATWIRFTMHVFTCLNLHNA